ncbi:hypothetical protein [Acidiplasma aeolicum]|nr:hypothetical protein [Acidiplasma aeolicum]
MYDVWNSLCALAVLEGKIEISKNIDNKPEESGIFRRSVGKIRGQIRDYRSGIYKSTMGIHLVEFTDHYELHVDSYDPQKYPVRHLIIDSPDTLIKTGMLLKTIKKIK